MNDKKNNVANNNDNNKKKRIALGTLIAAVLAGNIFYTVGLNKDLKAANSQIHSLEVDNDNNQEYRDKVEEIDSVRDQLLKELRSVDDFEGKDHLIKQLEDSNYSNIIKEQVKKEMDRNKLENMIEESKNKAHDLLDELELELDDDTYNELFDFYSDVKDKKQLKKVEKLVMRKIEELNEMLEEEIERVNEELQNGPDVDDEEEEEDRYDEQSEDAEEEVRSNRGSNSNSNTQKPKKRKVKKPTSNNKPKVKKQRPASKPKSKVKKPTRKNTQSKNNKPARNNSITSKNKEQKYFLSNDGPFKTEVYHTKKCSNDMKYFQVSKSDIEALDLNKCPVCDGRMIN